MTITTITDSHSPAHYYHSPPFIGGESVRATSDSNSTTRAYCDHCQADRQFEAHPSTPFTIVCTYCGHLVIDRWGTPTRKDLCTVLGLTRSASAVSERLDDGVRQTHPIEDSMGRTQQATTGRLFRSASVDCGLTAAPALLLEAGVLCAVICAYVLMRSRLRSIAGSISASCTLLHTASDLQRWVATAWDWMSPIVRPSRTLRWSA